jgi:hypothetical protein
MFFDLRRLSLLGLWWSYCPALAIDAVPSVPPSELLR